VLDISPVQSGSSVAVALRITLHLTLLAEDLGYNRYWLAEHHNTPLIASSVPEVMIWHVAPGGQEDSRRLGRRDAAEPFAAEGGGSVPRARSASPRARRPRPWPPRWRTTRTMAATPANYCQRSFSSRHRASPAAKAQSGPSAARNHLLPLRLVPIRGSVVVALVLLLTLSTRPLGNCPSAFFCGDNGNQGTTNLPGV